MRYNSQFEVNVTVSQKELDALEDILTCVPLCDKHRGLSTDNVDIEHMALDCDKCNNVRERWFKSAWNVYCKLGSAYEFCDKHD